MIQVGKKCRIKSYEEIKKTLDHRGRVGNCYFAKGMEKFCGTSVTIKWIYRHEIPYFATKENNWSWSEKWLIPINTNINRRIKIIEYVKDRTES